MFLSTAPELSSTGLCLEFNGKQGTMPSDDANTYVAKCTATPGAGATQRWTVSSGAVPTIVTDDLTIACKSCCLNIDRNLNIGWTTECSQGSVKYDGVFAWQQTLMKVMPQVTLPGADYKRVPEVNNVGDCQLACQAENACVAWTFQAPQSGAANPNALCTLKTPGYSYNQLGDLTRYTSGVMSPPAATGQLRDVVTGMCLTYGGADPEYPKAPSLTKDQAVGVGLGVTAAVLALGAGLFFYRRHRQKNSAPMSRRTPKFDEDDTLPGSEYAGATTGNGFETEMTNRATPKPNVASI